MVGTIPTLPFFSSTISTIKETAYNKNNFHFRMGVETDKILNIGISLESIGVKNWALTKQKALNVLTQFERLHIPILGGDVCELENGVMQYNYDNWYCDRLPNEHHLDFMKRSIKKAREYIEQYNSKEPDKIFFVLVPGV